MQVLPRWRNVLFFKNSFIQTTATTSSSPSPTQLASIHSTSTYLEKWERKWDPDVNGQEPSKSYIRYEVRQKRADAKKALKNLLCGSSKITVEEVHKLGNTNIGGREQRSYKKGRSKSSARRTSKAHNKTKKTKFRRDSSFEEFDEYPETFFQATYGNRCYTWSFRAWRESYFQNSASEFEWREHPNWTDSRNKEWDTAHETESDEESSFIGSYSERTVLGLPLKGSLTIEDVKTAFRLSALKWHPDKHQGPSQVMAEEKFKHCVDAYKSLCNALASG